LPIPLKYCREIELLFEENFMRIRKSTQQQIDRVRNRHQDELLGKQNVVGVVTAEKVSKGMPTGRPGLTVLVKSKVPPSQLSERDRIDPMLDGVETDVVETGELVAFANTARLRPALGGVSISHAGGGSGTLGCVLRSSADGREYLLSNNHVIGNFNMAQVGDPVLQPSRGDGGSAAGDTIATVARYPMVSQTNDNLVDCAIALVQPPTGPLAPLARPAILDGWSEVRQVPGWFGAQNQGGDVALAHISSPLLLDMVVLQVDNPAGENHAYYRIGRALDSNGNPTAGWSTPMQVPGWFGAEVQGAGIAIFDISGNGRPDLLVFHIDNPGGENRGYYRIGWDMNVDGVVASWSDVKPIPGWFGAEDQGGAVALFDINGNGRPELVVLHVDNPGGENRAYYRIGWNMDVNGNIASWGSPIPIPGWFGAETQGAGIAIGHFSSATRPDMVVFHADNPGGENTGYYRFGKRIRVDGTVSNWSETRQISGWMGAENQGAGIAAGDVNGDGIDELLSFFLDNPAGENQGYFRFAFDIGRSSDYKAGLHGTAPAALNMRVWKSGRTTELTNGSIRGLNGTFNITRSAGGPLWGRFVNQIAITPAIGAPGDSGSVIVNAQNRVVGLLFGGSSAMTIACPIEEVLEALRYSDVKAVPGWFGAEDQGADVAIADISRNGRPDLLVFHVDNPNGENHGFYRIGWNIDANGNAQGGWSPIMPVPGWFGAEDQGAGVAIAEVQGRGSRDLIVFHVDNPGGENHGFYRIGFNLNREGAVAGGWSPVKPVPGWFGAEDQGAAIAVGDINRSGRPDLVVFHVDNPDGENHGFYRIGFDLNTNGDPASWSPVMRVPGWFGAQNQGAGIALADVSGNGQLDLIVYHVDNPGGENHGYYRIGFNLNSAGRVTGGWSAPRPIPGWFGAENQGAGLAVADLNGNGRPDLLVLHVDNPSGENAAYYRTVFDLMPDGIPAQFAVTEAAPGAMALAAEVGTLANVMSIAMAAEEAALVAQEAAAAATAAVQSLVAVGSAPRAGDDYGADTGRNTNPKTAQPKSRAHANGAVRVPSMTQRAPAPLSKS
jgi:hypothetical protein